MTGVQYGSETCALPKTEERLLDVFFRGIVPIVLVMFLTDISNSKLCGKCGSIVLSRAIMTERLRWLEHVLW